MSRFSIFIISLFVCISASAQQKAVKEAEHILAAAKPDYAAALRTIRPALTHDETKQMPSVWFTAGKAAFGVWDRMLLNMQIGQEVKDDQKKEAAHDLIDAYNYLMTAMPLDSLPNAKGKIKPQYTKEIRKLLVKYYGAFRNAGIFLYGLKDYPGAYEAWDIYTNLPQRLNASGHRVLRPDDKSDLGQIYYYQALTAISTNRNDKAVEKFLAAQQSGFSSKDLYLYGMEAARRMEADSVMLQFARTGAELYGNQDVSFLLVLINDRLAEKDYEGCRRLVNEALRVQSDDKVKSQLYDVLGVIDENQGLLEDALTNFQKSVVFNENFAKGYFDLARVIYNESLKIAETAVEAEVTAKAVPGLRKAAEYFEKAYSIDPKLPQIPETLYNIYYRLGVGYEDKAAYWEKLQ